MKKRKIYDDNFKARVALEAIKGERTISEIAGQFEVNFKYNRSLLSELCLCGK